MSNDKMSYHNFLRFGTYTGISFSVLLSIVYPDYKIFTFLVIGGWLVYAIADTWKMIENHQESFGYKPRVMKALSNNALDLGLFFLSVVVAIVLGIQK
jgi:uncharacterized membrane protein YjjB (DUF3815 family)